MRIYRTPIGVVGLAVCGVILAACQSYHFPQVTPEAISTINQPTPIQGVLKPAKIMLVLDKSGSMATNPDNDDWGCCLGGIDGTPMAGNAQCNYDVGGGCKWNSLKTLLLDDLGNGKGGFLDQAKKDARFGLAIFPDLGAGTTGDSCSDGKILVDVGASDNVAAIKAQLTSATVFPKGGTPTAHMLQSIVSDSNFVNAEENTPRYVILITDGEPNCNSQLNGASCVCTTGDCSNPQNCLDATATVDQIKALYATQPDANKAGIKTFVIGFGADTAGTTGAVDVLNDAAVAGHTDQQLDPSATPPVTTRYYQATNQTELEAILGQILGRITPCTFGLDQKPDSESMLEVTLTDSSKTTPFDGNCQNICGTDCCLESPGDWTFTDTTVTINGAWCTALQNAEPNRYTLNFLSVHVMQ
jgi:hypothetical protein